MKEGQAAVEDDKEAVDCGGWGNGSRTHLLRSTVVTLKTTPLSHRIMKSLWEKGQFPMLSPSLPALNKHTDSKLE